MDALVSVANLAFAVLVARPSGKKASGKCVALLFRPWRPVVMIKKLLDYMIPSKGGEVDV
ncbi:hypothetical protein [Thermosinus carboxydivorans]|uniref:hypothetical protein n=1 Tax=Thermosinus carboxydivorans TaxID=261685 RepID=UPI0002F3F6FB|nr:hypothetical protein [Thermosinus carboxydivorans]